MSTETTETAVQALTTAPRTESLGQALKERWGIDLTS